MDYKTKECYRNKIKKLSQKTKISEIYITKKVLELAQKAKQPKKKHIGYYLIDRGENLLNNKLGIKKKRKTQKPTAYIASIYIFTIIFSILIGIYVFYKINLPVAILAVCLSVVPVSEIYIQALNYILGKFVKPKPLPKLAFQNGIPEEYSTMVIIPTIVNSKEKVIELFKKIEVYYLANKEENLYFTLLRRLHIIKK